METLKKYERVFNSQNSNWTESAKKNLLYLNAIQLWSNDLLRARGDLMLNEVYDALGFSRTRSGWTDGWVYDRSNQVGDGFVDFGIRVCEEGNSDIMLSFNATKNIIDVIFKEEES